jgi:hypothetical protein
MSQSLAKKNTNSVANLINSYFNVLLLKEGNNNNIDEVMKAFITVRDIACNLKDDEKKKAFDVISEQLKEFSKMSNDSRVLNFIEEFSYDLLIELMANFSDNYTYEDAYDLESKSEISECKYECETWEFSSF